MNKLAPLQFQNIIDGSNVNTYFLLVNPYCYFDPCIHVSDWSGQRVSRPVSR